MPFDNSILDDLVFVEAKTDTHTCEIKAGIPACTFTPLVTDTEPFANLPPPVKATKNKQGRALLEADIEDYGRKRFKELGWSFEKFTSPQKRSVPDDICIAPDYPTAFVFWIEFKRPGETATTNQSNDHAKRRALGGVVFVVDCFGQLDLTVDIVKWILKNGVVPKLPLYLMK